MPSEDKSHGSRAFALLAVAVLLLAPLTGCISLGGDDGDGQGVSVDDPGGSDGMSTSGGIWVGAWLGVWPNRDNRAIQNFQQKIDHNVAVIEVPLTWNTSYSALEATLQYIAAAGKRPLITWSPTNLTTDDLGDDDTEIVLQDNTTVTLEQYVRTFSEGLCDFYDYTGTKAYLEPMPEPNGNWHTWSVGYADDRGDQPNTAQSYKHAWNHIYSHIEESCPDGLTVIWTINGANRGSGTSYMGAFPGEDKTDMSGIRGLNLGKYQARGWADFSTTYGGAYCALTQDTDLPIVLTAVGSVEAGGSKARWISQAFQSATSDDWTGIQGLVWYNDKTYLTATDVADFTVDSTSSSLEAYRAALDDLGSGETGDASSPPC